MTLEKILKRLIVREPFWGIVALGLNKRFTDSCPTLGVRKAGIGVELLVNPKFWESLSDSEQLAVILHELHHIALMHLFMQNDFPDKQRFNIAADCEVNGYITGLPDGCVLAKHFKLQNKQGVKYYYKHLPKSVSAKLLGDHDGWKDFRDMPEAQKELVRNTIGGMLARAAKSCERGTIPGELCDILDELLKEKPRIYDWKRDLRRRLGSEIETSLKKTRQRESKRFKDGAGLKFRRKTRVLVAVDTSGSVSDRELADFFSEINHIMKAGTSIHVVEFDSQVSSDWEYTGLRNINITGRGGTDFAAPVEWYKKHRKDFTMFVLFTDGWAPIEGLDVPDMTWVITSDGNRQAYPGKVIYIPA